MPEEYEKIRDSCIASHKHDEKTCKAIGAATYNKRHPGNPVTNKHHEEYRAIINSVINESYFKKLKK